MTAAVPAHAAEFKVTDNCSVPWINCTEGDIFLFYNSKAYSYNSDGSRYVTSWSTFYGNVYDYWAPASTRAPP
ncbi:hypothetical protein KEF29_05460 [Streptomyces tuirus]|uniref:Uncharacterized protein n=1 Tax=Streptomyces tuirus TaxID=68278 RepID=A0A941FFD4_9ACTN|nr:hypothetical protein [Streptomyces tuirus]